MIYADSLISLILIIKIAVEIPIPIVVIPRKNIQNVFPNSFSSAFVF